jgi:integrase
MAEGQKHALPLHLATAGTADYDRLVPPPGPWMQDVWVVRPQGGDYRRLAPLCAVPDCETDVHEVGAGLCHAHAWQWYRAGRPMPVIDWIPLAKPPVRRRTARPSIDFRPLPPRVAQEIRYVVGTKITCGDWTPSWIVRTALDRLILAVADLQLASLFDLPPQRLLERASTISTNGNSVRPYLKTFFVTLHRTAVADPWSQDSWLWRHSFEALLGDTSGAAKSNIHWGKIHQIWLREAAKTLARRRLIAGDVAWGTVLDWAKHLRRFSGYLASEGVSRPDEVDRDLFLEFLAVTRMNGASKNALMGVNTTASILADLRGEGLVPDLGSEIFLRYRENAVRRAAEPRPFPADVTERIEVMLDTDTEIDPVARAMLRFNTWGGLRVSELVSLPLDCLMRNHAGGWWVEYFMPKTQDWRRFPIPDDIAEIVLAQQRFVRELYGPEAPFMFPAVHRSSRLAQVCKPWSAEGFRGHIRRAFLRNGITQSSITGEPISGSSIHRYRHTIGTTLLNNQWTQTEVQEFLGHRSSTMTAHYARITDDTLNRKAHEFSEQRRQERGTLAYTSPRENAGVERLRAKFTAVLPDGYCQLPTGQHCDFRQNPCKTCAFYDDGGEDFRVVHDNHRRRLTLFVVDHQDDLAKVAINQANLDALNARVPEVS